MVRREKVNELIYGKVAGILNEELTKYGFKYQKSKHNFLRKVNEFNQELRLNANNPEFSYDSTTEKIFLNFRLRSEIAIPAFNKWFKQKTGYDRTSHFSIQLIECQLELSIDDFSAKDVFTPNPAQIFKNYVSSSIQDTFNKNKTIIQTDDLLNFKLSELIDGLSEKSDILKLYKQKDYTVVPLLIYGGYTELANQEIDKKYQNYIDRIETQRQIPGNSLDSLMWNFDCFISLTNKLTQKEYINPFTYKPTGEPVNALNNQHDKVAFSEDIKFEECLRIDTAKTNSHLLHVFPNNDILLIVDKKKIVKLNSKTELIVEQDLKEKKGYTSTFWPSSYGVIKESGEFYVDNYILTNDDKIIELELSCIKTNPKESMPSISDLVYHPTKEKYLALYGNFFLTFSKQGILENTLKIVKAKALKIITEREWILTQEKKKGNSIINFNGDLINTYEYGHGNRSIKFSANSDYLICYGYSTKSQIYNLKDDKKGVLWAHPTYVKDYTEVLYKGTEHNFGLGEAEFSPDTSYIVGGAYHGKYVAWNLPKLERVELIPQTEVVEQLKPIMQKLYTNGEWQEYILKPELVVLDGKTFLRNRGNWMKDIIFFDGGDFFLTSINNQEFWLLWDRNFNNIAYKKFAGRISFHSSEYVSRVIDDDLIIYKRH